MKKLAIVGSALAGGCAQIIDAVRTDSVYEPVGIFDRDTSTDTKVLGVPVLASSSEVFRYWEKDQFDEVIIAIGGNLIERQKIFQHL